MRPTGLTFRLVRPDPETPAKTETTKPNAITTNLNVQLFVQLFDFVRIIVWSVRDWVANFDALFWPPFWAGFGPVHRAD